MELVNVWNQHWGAKGKLDEFTVVYGGWKALPQRLRSELIEKSFRVQKMGHHYPRDQTDIYGTTQQEKKSRSFQVTWNIKITIVCSGQ